VRALHDPAVLAQALTALDNSPGESACDASLLQGCSAPLVVIAFISMQLSRLARQTLDGRHNIDASLELNRPDHPRHLHASNLRHQ
jgi:hypothetical protein